MFGVSLPTGDPMLSALIFDVDGTLADTESVHLEAFNHAFRQEGLGWHWDVPLYTRLLDISGGKERMLHHWRSVEPERTELTAGAVPTPSTACTRSRPRTTRTR
jgi:phosphoglycolate phosphatase-like HAD superfamily hydrolase